MVIVVVIVIVHVSSIGVLATGGSVRVIALIRIRATSTIAATIASSTVRIRSHSEVTILGQGFGFLLAAMEVVFLVVRSRKLLLRFLCQVVELIGELLDQLGFLLLDCLQLLLDLL
jgi:hypothetical protein